ncbi:MAG: hypothetical protein GY757_50505, partial [bacterium]|nr:hypothetical protein [bacterium]
YELPDLHPGNGDSPDKKKSAAPYPVNYGMARNFDDTAYNVSFLASNGKYVSAAASGRLTATGDEITLRESFNAFELPGNKIRLQANNGQFVRIDGEELVANSPSFGTSEVLEIVSLGDNKVALQTQNERFVSATGEETGNERSGPGLIANCLKIRRNEIFTMIKG